MSASLCHLRLDSRIKSIVRDNSSQHRERRTEEGQLEVLISQQNNTQPSPSLEAMISRHMSVLIFFLLCVCMAIAEEPDEGGQRSVSPYWNLWSSDFFGWVEELRAQGAYDRINDLARTFWSHFSIADQLGYDRPDADPEPED